jgi:LPS export ABC transporter protein LptC
MSLLLFMSIACSKEKQEKVEVAFDPENSFTMKTTDVFTLISDSGITRYSAKAAVWLAFDKAKEPYWYFPEGIYLEQFDTLFNVKASIKADTAYHYNKQELWRGIGNVEMQNREGEHFSTSLINWDQKLQKIYSDKDIRIETLQGKIITGKGFISNSSLTVYKIFEPGGIFIVEDASPDTTAVSGEP